MANGIVAQNEISRNCEIHLEAQGSLVALAVNHHPHGFVGGGRRGRVVGFSKASRRRLLRKLSRLDDTRPKFITLTYPSEYPDAQTAKRHLRAFLQRVRRRVPEASAVWRLEFQDRGAPHFHLLCYNWPYISFETVKSWWSEIIGVIDSQPLFVRVEQVRSKRGTMYYASKYMSKPTARPAAGAFFNYDAYLYAGRVWGVFNAGFLPLATQLYQILPDIRWRAFHDTKKFFRRRFRRITKQRAKGGCIFADDAYAVFFAALRILTDDYLDERIDYSKWSRYQWLAS